MKLLLGLVFALTLPAFQERAPEVSRISAESAAFTRIGAEKNLEAKKKLAANFEKGFPKSNRLPEVFMELSRALIAASDFATARQYADKAVTVVARMKSEAAADGNLDRAHQQWLASMEATTKKNLEWVNQMIAWREQQVRSSVLGKR